MSKHCFLVTGAQGCIGSWVVKKLLDMDHEVIAFDVHTRPLRLSLLVRPEKLLAKFAVIHVIHLAGLQTPECRANPILGAATDVVSTLALFEAELFRGLLEEGRLRPKVQPPWAIG